MTRVEMRAALIRYLDAKLRDDWAAERRALADIQRQVDALVAAMRPVLAALRAQ